MTRRVSGLLPDFPWDTIADARARAFAHPDGVADLSVGTPVDPVPQLALDALAASASGWAGYPTVWGTPALRRAIIDYLTRRWEAVPLEDRHVLPVMGTKELVAALPAQLGLGEGDVVVLPSTAYPTYEVGALLAGATPVLCDDPAQAAAHRPKLIWINSPANPTGEILPVARLTEWVDAARSVGAVLAADECYGEFGWDAEPVSVLRADVNGGSLEGILAAHSLSKRSNIAGYRAGFVAGDADVVGELLAVRKHAGAMVPGPVQDVMTALLGDHTHVEEQRQRYLARRAVLAPALEASGFTIAHSQGSLYLWCTRGESGRASVDWLAERGILAAPGEFYGEASRDFVRVALTASDAMIAQAAQRLTSG